MWRKVIQFSLGIAIAAGGLWIFFRDVDPHRMWAELRSVNVLVLIIVAALSPLSLWLRSIRWRFMLPKTEYSNTKHLFSAVMIGFMVNNILPARAGEAARALLLWRRNGFTVAQSIGSLVVERIIDTLVFLSFFFIPIYIIPSLHKLTGYALFFTAVFDGVIVLAAVYAFFPGFARSTAGKLLPVVPGKIRGKTAAIVKDLVSNLDWLFSPSRVVLIVVFSYLTVLCYPVMIMVLTHGIKSFGFMKAAFCQACAAFGAAVPLAPGYVGTVHAAMRMGFDVLGVSGDKALAIIIIYHAVSFVVITVLGLIYFFATNISMKEIERAKKEMGDSGQAKESAVTSGNKEPGRATA